MRTFFAELRYANVDTTEHVHFDAPDLTEAVQYLNFFALGAMKANAVKIELLSIGAYKVKGRKYVRLG